MYQVTCEWLPSGKCAPYTNCGDTQKAINYDCFNWNPKCVSDGSKCVRKGTCSSYQTEKSCSNEGTDGLCKWTESACRLRECVDNNADGAPCIFDQAIGQIAGIKSCRPRDCTDIKGTTNDQCIGSIPNKSCVADGTTCANYKNKISCKAGGSDGACAFTPTAADGNVGTSTKFKSCEIASYDYDTCMSKPKSCKWSYDALKPTTSCATMDCASAGTSIKCVPVPNFYSSSFTICVTANGTCTAGDPLTITQEDCYKTTNYSYTWNESIKKCVSCKGITTPSNNSTEINTSLGKILEVIVTLAILEFIA